MNKKILIVIYFLVTFSPKIIFAEKVNVYSEGFEITSYSLRNPFKSQLPKRKKIVQPKKELQRRNAREDRPVQKPKPPLSRFSSKKPEKREKPNEPKKLIDPTLKMTINGLIWNSDRPQAIIDDKIVDVGDYLGEVKIIDIHKEGVDVKFSGQFKTLKLKE